MGKILQDVVDYIKEAKLKHDEFVTQADSNLDMVMGKQWDDSDLAKRKLAKLPTYTVNIIKPYLKLISGYQRQSHTDIRLLPEESGDFFLAEAMSAIVKNVTEYNQCSRLDADVYLTANIMRRAYYYIYEEETEKGTKVRIKTEDPRNILKDPYGREVDFSDSEFVIVRRYMSERKIKQLFPKSDWTPDAFLEDFQDEYMDILLGDTKSRKYAIYECFVKDTEIVKDITDPMGQTLENVDDDIIRDLKEMGLNFDIKEKRVDKIKLMTVSAGKELQNVDAPFKEHPFCRRNFPVFMYQPFSLFGQEGCIVEDMEGIQKEKNHRRSQFAHLVNLYANAPWWRKKGALEDPKVLEEFGSSPNVVIDLKVGAEFGKDVGRVQPANVPNYVERLDAIDSATAKEVTGLNPDLLGFAEKTSSGRAIALRQQAGMVIQTPEIDKFLDTKKRMASFLVGAIQVTMPPQEMIRILGRHDYVTVPVELEQQFMQMYGESAQMAVEQWKEQQMQVLIGELKNTEAHSYDVKIELFEKQATKRAADFETLKEVAQLYPGVIPPHLFVKASDIPYKEEILNYLKIAGLMPAQSAGGGVQMPQSDMAQAQVPPEQLGVNTYDEDAMR